MKTQNEVLECDVLVIGSGASGLSAAVTAAHHGLKVIVVEKAARFGGTSAWSGGWMWVPNNPLSTTNEAPEEAELYLTERIGSKKLNQRQMTYLEYSPAMVDFFLHNTTLDFLSGDKMPDMFDGVGSREGGRSLCALPYDGRKLGNHLSRLEPPLDIMSLAGMGIAGGADLGHFLNARSSLKSALYVSRRLIRHARDMLLYKRSTWLVNGNALVARLLRTALDLQVTLLEETQAIRLLESESMITGAELLHNGKQFKVHACRGIVLACGGFPHDQSRIKKLSHSSRHHYSAAPRTNRGDGLALAESIGAELRSQTTQPLAWAPVSLVPRKDGSIGHFPHLVDRAKPGFIAVLRNGHRFTNEADCYHQFIQDLLAKTSANEEPEAWLICDHQAQRRFGLGWSKPFPFPTSLYSRLGYLKVAKTLSELAEICGIDGPALEQTVEHFNQSAIEGEDKEFQRGISRYNRAQGDAKHLPNPSLGTLSRPPFYAVRLVVGSLGSFAGLDTDKYSRVLDTSQEPIKGLYAVGNDSASIFEGSYPSGGITLGPALTFGWIAGKHISGEMSPLTDNDPLHVMKHV